MTSTVSSFIEKNDPCCSEETSFARLLTCGCFPPSPLTSSFSSS
ncbi:hypothetical protein ADUPG1_014916, partial [Aduncisulcus paluster]